MIKHIQYFIILTLLVGMASCAKKEPNFILKGTIKGLKKGTVYLQKEGDSSIINLDSVAIMGEPEFTLSTDLDEPEVLYLKLHKKDGLEHYIPFFADKGTMEISTTLDRFSYDANISGSEQQEILEAYLKIAANYNEQNLNLIKDNFEAQKNSDQKTVDSLNLRSERLLKLKYAATINFALNHGDSEVAAYLALYELPNASLKYLDSIYTNLSPKIKTSLYGKRLGNAIETFKKSQDSIL